MDKKLLAIATDETCESLVLRLKCAIKAKCYRTARARIREMSLHISQKYGISYETSRKLLINKYAVNCAEDIRKLV